MKLSQYLFPAVLAVLSLVACGTTAKGMAEVEESVFSGKSVNGAGDGLVTRTLSLKGFHGLKLEDNVDVNYTQGDNYKVTVTGDDRLLAGASVKVEDGLLVVGWHRDGSAGTGGNAGRIRLAVTAPSIDRIENNGICTFSTGRMSVRGYMDIRNSGKMIFRSEKLGCAVYNLYNSGVLQCEGDLSVRKFNMENGGSLIMTAVTLDSDGIVNIDNNGVLAFNVDGVSCSVFHSGNSGSFTHNGRVAAKGSVRIENRGVYNSESDYDVSGDMFRSGNSGSFIHNGRVTAKGNVLIENSGVYKSESDYDVSGVITVESSGTDKFKGSVKAREFRCKVRGVGNNCLDINADRLDFDISGTADMKLAYRGGDARVRCHGKGNVGMNLKCGRIEAVNTGSAVITLRGTADDVTIGGTVVSEVETGRLNRL